MSSVSTTSQPATAALPPLHNSRPTVELVAGFAVIVVFVLLLGLAVVSSGRKTDAGYQLKAGFSHIDGLDIGSDVKLAGIRIGHVASAGGPEDFPGEGCIHGPPGRAAASGQRRNYHQRQSAWR